MYLSSGDVNKFVEHRPADSFTTRRSGHTAVITVVVVEVDRK